MRKTHTKSLLALAALAVALLPYAADSGPCTDHPAARDLYVTSYTDSLLNRPKGEDTNFFISAGVWNRAISSSSTRDDSA